MGEGVCGGVCVRVGVGWVERVCVCGEKESERVSGWESDLVRK